MNRVVFISKPKVDRNEYIEAGLSIKENICPIQDSTYNSLIESLAIDSYNYLN